MTISTVQNSVKLNGDGVTSTFSFNFSLLKSDFSDLFVYKIDVDEETQEESQTLLTQDIDYSVNVLKDINLNILSGSVALNFIPTVNQKIFILREENLLQETKIIINQKFPEKEIEKSIDKLTLISQQQQAVLDKTLRISPTSDATLSSFAETPQENKAVVWKKDQNNKYFLGNSKDNPDEVYNDIVNNPNVIAVGTNIDNVNSVASNIANVNSISTNIDNVNSVAGDLNNINIVANNLDIQRNLVIGELKHFARTDIPSGWLRCDGTQYTRGEFPNFWDDYLTQNKIPTCSYADYSTEISNNNGSCGKFAVDLVNLTFKVPTIQGQVFVAQALASGDIGKYNLDQIINHGHSIVGYDGETGTNYNYVVVGTNGTSYTASTNSNTVINANSGDKTYPRHIQYPILVCVANVQVPVSEAQYNGFISNLTQKVDLDGSNATFSNLDTTAKDNIINAVLGSLQTTDPNKIGYVIEMKDNQTTPTNNTYTLPAGGTWFVHFVCVGNNGVFYGYGSGGRIVAGGTSIAVDSRTASIYGLAMKIQ